MELRDVLASQYRSSLAMLRSVIADCPDEAWADERFRVPSWRIAYHTVFFTNLYLQKSPKAFKAWDGCADGVEGLGPKAPSVDEPYSRERILGYVEDCSRLADEQLPIMDLDGPCGFHWYDTNKLEHQLINIRHVQHHAAQLADRLRNVLDKGIPWVGWKHAGQ
jgi:hypothetical protein